MRHPLLFCWQAASGTSSNEGPSQEEMQAARAEQGLDLETKAAIKEIFDLFEDWTIEKAMMRDRFVDGLKAQLNDDQLAYAATDAWLHWRIAEKADSVAAGEAIINDNESDEGKNFITTATLLTKSP